MYELVDEYTYGQLYNIDPVSQSNLEEAIEKAFEGDIEKVNELISMSFNHSALRA